MEALSLGFLVLKDLPILCARQDRHFYLLFLLSRKASNAMSRLPKDIKRTNISVKMVIISYAVIRVTSFLMYSTYVDFINSGGCHPVMSALTGEFYHVANFETMVYRPLIFQVIYVIVPPANMVSSRPS